MAKYLDEAGLSTLWTKIKETFVAQKIKKSSDSNNATSIVHNGQRVSLSTGKMMSSSTEPGKTVYAVDSSIVIDGNNIHFTADNRPSYRKPGEDFVNLVISSDIATSSTVGLVKSTTTGTTENRDYMVEVNPDGTMKVNVPWTDNNTTYTIATSSTPGLVKLVSDDLQTTAANGITKTSSRTYAVQKNSNNQLVVNVPWTDTKTTVDSALSSTSTNPVQNKVINTALSSTNTIVSSHTTAISTLESYFDNEGSALHAVNDEDGHSIIATYATKDELNTFKGLKGQPNGLASLDSSGKVPSSQLPSYVDDVIEGYYYNSKFYKESSHTTEIAGESGKIYTDLGNNKTYRWSGTTYTEISASLALGETESTAYPGNKGKANAANITTLKGYFNSSGVANKAAADGNGNNIVDTYATKQNLASVAQNASAKIDKSVLTAKGDIIYASEASTPAKLAIGANGKVLKVVNGIPAWSDDNNTHNSHIVYSGKKADGSTDISSGTASSGNITLGDSGVTAGSYGDTSNQTPSYGSTFKVPSLTVNAKGIVTGIATHTVKIPANNATTSAAGLMSAADKTKLDGIEAISISTIENLS